MTVSPVDVARENERLEKATPEERLAFAVQAFGDRLLFTSSFGTGSGVLLHMWSRVAGHLPVVVVDTGFLFDETIAYRDRMARDLGLRLEIARPELARDDFLWQHGADIMERDPDFCCAQNKIAPLKPWVARSLGWVSGLRRDQSRTRERVPILLPTEEGPIKVHPLATMTRAEAQAYMETHGIPEHPLKAKRYLSIGCWPCTQPVADGGDERDGRWAGRAKTECGLHTFLKPKER
ncbi:MAG: phosphoadenylyl-sulfate reductase [Myxococcota bacterium]|nr:phosphoadenylyl-sulfate reductase [Myxococcota bacterium]